MFEAARFQLPYDFGRFPGHLLDNRAFDRGEIKRTAAQHNHRLVAVKRQVSELQHNLESPAADHHYIDAGKEFREPVRLLLTCLQEVERVIQAGQKPIDARSAEDRKFHGRPPELTLDFMPTPGESLVRIEPTSEPWEVFERSDSLLFPASCGYLECKL